MSLRSTVSGVGHSSNDPENGRHHGTSKGRDETPIRTSASRKQQLDRVDQDIESDDKDKMEVSGMKKGPLLVAIIGGDAFSWLLASLD